MRARPGALDIKRGIPVKDDKTLRKHFRVFNGPLAVRTRFFNSVFKPTPDSGKDCSGSGKARHG